MVKRVTPKLSIAELLLCPLGLVALALISPLKAQEIPEMSTLVQYEMPASQDPIFLAPGETHTYSFDLAKEEWLHLGIEQLGVDVQLRWHPPESLKHPVVLLDRPTGSRGLEELRELTEIPGRFRLEVSANKPKASGHYRIEFLERRPAEALDRSVLSADRKIQQARQLLKDGERKTSLDLLEAAIAILDRLHQPVLEADALELQGRLYFALGQIELALDSWQGAMTWYRQVGERRLLAAVLHNRTVAQLRLGQGHEAIQELEESRKIFAEEGDLWAEATAVSRQASIEHRLGRFHLALNHYSEAIALARKAGRSEVVASILIDQGSVLLTLRRPHEAIKSLEQAGKQSPTDSQSIEQASRETVRLQGLAEAHHQLGNSDRALELATQALQQQYRVDDRRTRATLLNIIGNIHLGREDLKAARRAVENGLRFAGSTQDTYTAAFLEIALGHIERLEGQPETALSHFERVDQKLQELPSSRLSASNHTRAAQALIDLGHLLEAWERLQIALSEVEELRNSAARQDHRIGYFAFRQEYYEITLHLLSKLHQLHPKDGYGAQAFRVHERRLARELVDRSGLGPQTAAPTLENARSVALKERIRRLSTSDRQSDRAELKHALSALYTNRSPKTVRAPFLDLETNLDLVLETLDSETLVLSFALGHEHSHLWAIDKQGIEFSDLPPRSMLEVKARNLADLLESGRPRSQRAAGKLANEISTLLLGPIDPKLADYRRLVIVGEGALLQIPFAYLKNPSSDAPLIVSHEIVSLPSLSLLPHLLEDQASSPTRQILALFGDPIYGPNDPRWVSSSSVEGTARASSRTLPEVLRSETLVRLPNSRAEVESIRKLASGSWQVKLHTGSQASRQAFHSICSAEGKTGCDVLHIASHALLAPEPELSGLMLSFLDTAGEYQEGFVPAFEIAELYLPARLVVLSACQTGVGTPIPGEGMRGLSWAFFHAGARRVIASLWRVGDQPTALLMERFYAALLQDRQPPAAALRQAQNSLRAEGYPARDWAAFVFQGNWNSFLPPLRELDPKEFKP